MVLSLFHKLLHLLAAAILLLSAPGYAHEEHRRNEQAQAVSAATGEPAQRTAMTAPGAPGEGERVGREVPRSTGERLIDWLGRLHPLIVHFPLALIPTAFLALLLGRRRLGLLEGARFLLLLGGASAVVAMLLGWFDAGFVLFDGRELILAHRWLGTAIGLALLGVTVWAWRRPESISRRPMLLTVGTITAALVAQGWLGGALVHGVDHLAW